MAEWHVYGNEQQGRFLTKYPEVEPTYYGQGITEDIRNGIFSRQLGKKAYELKDHLGNVRVTFSDVKMPTIQTAPPYNRTAPYSVDLHSKSEYFPYGMVIDDLSFNLSDNRYGFGGTHELDNEVKGGVGRHLSFGDFGYDTRVGRRFNNDPIDQIFISNYAGFGNNPIFYSDPTGFAKEIINGKERNLPDETVVEADKILPEETSGNTQASLIPSDNTGVKLDFLPKKREIFDPTQEIMPGGKSNPDSKQGFRPGDDLMFDAALLSVGLRNPFGTNAFKTAGVEVIGTESAIKVVSAEVVATREGVYILSTTIEKYVGQSQNILKRLSQHFGKNGMFANYQNAEKVLIQMPGSTKLEREIYEQYVIQSLNITKLKNKVNPMGGRMDLYYKEVENVINKYNLPRF